jgi:hypothetical protein
MLTEFFDNRADDPNVADDNWFSGHHRPGSIGRFGLIEPDCIIECMVGENQGIPVPQDLKFHQAISARDLGMEDAVVHPP